MQWRFLASLPVLAAGLVIACTSGDTKEESLCVANKPVFCRCRDRQEGQKTCNAEGNAFGPCEPCETYDNPEWDGDGDPPEPPDPPERDGSAPGCGDGIVQLGEDCDVGDGPLGDGCDQDCKLSGVTPPASNACPGLVVHVWGDGHRPSLASRTDGAGNRRLSPSCGATPTTGSVAPDRVFQVVAHKTGTMTVTTSDTGYNAFLYAAAACSQDVNVAIACANETNGPGPETLSFPVENGKTYWVFVDGTGTTNNAGDFRVTFAVP